MNITLFAQSGVFHSLQRLAQRWRAQRPHMPVPSVPVAQAQPHVAHIFIAKPFENSRAVRKNSTHPRPLRVVRVVETGPNLGNVGRMVISGRMADVCAELDRLADREAAHT